ncbi:REP element-mobilizing transposase RayT [Microbacter margulisiae]|uniref:REP element-mobilizing transposase RayT n=2 Tax=Microbacter margulisiae TaxID=1350067 RepID=A0A7W5DTD8_9PORP|nr:REP element-mobilizing transposase RayT [Microbacter margulisiae]
MGIHNIQQTFIMANTYTQIYIHYVFAVQNRLGLIQNRWRDDLYKYMSGTIANKEHKLLAMGGMPDHVHVLVSMSPKQSPSDLMADVKRSSSLWINENRFVMGKFAWQEGYGAFSYGKSQIHDVANYIERQEQHHKKQTFMEEYLEFQRLFEIELDERYVFRQIE